MLAKLVSESFCVLVTHTALLGLYVSYYHFAYIANYHWVNPMAIQWQSNGNPNYLFFIWAQFLLNTFGSRIDPRARRKVAPMAKFWLFPALMWS